MQKVLTLELQNPCLKPQLLQKPARITLRTACHFGRRTRSDDPSALLAPFGPDVDQMVGDLDDVEIVLDDDHRIAPIDKFGQYVEQLADILEMESRRGFVQNIKRAARIALGEFARQLDALALAARQGRTWLAERQIAQSNILNSLEFLMDRGDVGETRPPY